MQRHTNYFNIIFVFAFDPLPHELVLSTIKNKKYARRKFMRKICVLTLYVMICVLFFKTANFVM